MLVANHAPFTWGADCAKAIEHAQVLEFVARLEWRVRVDGAGRRPRPDAFLVDKHFLRKHGPERLPTDNDDRRGAVGSRRDAGRLRGVSTGALARHDRRPRA